MNECSRRKRRSRKKKVKHTIYLTDTITLLNIITLWILTMSYLELNQVTMCQFMLISYIFMFVLWQFIQNWQCLCFLRFFFNTSNFFLIKVIYLTNDWMFKWKVFDVCLKLNRKKKNLASLIHEKRFDKQKMCFLSVSYCLVKGLTNLTRMVKIMRCVILNLNFL